MAIISSRNRDPWQLSAAKLLLKDFSGPYVLELLSNLVVVVFVFNFGLTYSRSETSLAYAQVIAQVLSLPHRVYVQLRHDDEQVIFLSKILEY